MTFDSRHIRESGQFNIAKVKLSRSCRREKNGVADRRIARTDAG